MVSFFDYLYFSICLFYAQARDKGALSSAAALVGLFQALNIITVLLFIELFRSEKFLNKPLAVAVAIGFQITTYIRYIYKDNHSIGLIEKKWLAETELSRKRLRFFFWIYSIASVVACVALAIFIGDRN